jgi:NSS family neurotransmitter:Na+ symporter
MERENWTNNIIFILTVAGAAIGLGNIWRFPYLVGTNGGAAFVIIYLLMVIVIGIPLLMTEMVIGRSTQKNSVDAFGGVNISKLWKIVGYMGLLGAFGILSYYTVLAGWVLGYGLFTASGVINLTAGATQEYYTNFFDNFVVNTPLIILFSFIFIIMNYFILIKGIKGIGKVATYLVPSLFIIVIIISIKAITLEGAMEGVKFYLVPDFSKLTAMTYLTALGQVFFSFSIGFGVSITLASYLNKKDNIAKSATLAGLADFLIAFLAGFMIFPAVFAFGLDPAAGTSLVFKVLPLVFSQMTFGVVIAFLFFLILLIAAFTSSITIYEVIITVVIEKFNYSRKKATIITLSFVALLGNLPSILGFSIWKKVSILGMNIFDAFDYFSGNILFPLTAMLLALFAGYIMKERAIKELTNNGSLKFIWIKLWIFIIKYLAPVAIIFIFISNF